MSKRTKIILIVVIVVIIIGVSIWIAKRNKKATNQLMSNASAAKVTPKAPVAQQVQAAPAKALSGAGNTQ